MIYAKCKKCQISFDPGCPCQNLITDKEIRMKEELFPKKISFWRTPYCYPLWALLGGVYGYPWGHFGGNFLDSIGITNDWIKLSIIIPLLIISEVLIFNIIQKRTNKC